jgi:hypothetical protein
MLAGCSASQMHALLVPQLMLMLLSMQVYEPAVAHQQPLAQHLVAASMQLWHRRHHDGLHSSETHVLSAMCCTQHRLSKLQTHTHASNAAIQVCSSVRATVLLPSCTLYVTASCCSLQAAQPAPPRRSATRT